MPFKETCLLLALFQFSVAYTSTMVKTGHPETSQLSLQECCVYMAGPSPVQRMRHNNSSNLESCQESRTLQNSWYMYHLANLYDTLWDPVITPIFQRSGVQILSSHYLQEDSRAVVRSKGHCMSGLCAVFPSLIGALEGTQGENEWLLPVLIPCSVIWK